MQTAIQPNTTRFLLRRDGRIKKQVLEALAVLYCATAYDIARYVYKRLPTDSDLHVVRRAINSLLAEKHAKLKKKDFHGKEKIFGLTRYGAMFMRNKGHEDAREFEIKDLDHEHHLTLVQLALIEFARERSIELEWKRPTVDYRERINPDGLATFKGTTWQLTFIIEVERQTFNESYMKKAKKFREVFDTDEAERLFGDRKFRVIFAVETDMKRTTVLKHYAEEYNHKMYWLTTIALLVSVPAESIFKTSKDYFERAYSFLDIFPK